MSKVKSYKSKIPQVQINTDWAKYLNVNPFPDKLNAANEFLEKAGLPSSYDGTSSLKKTKKSKFQRPHLFKMGPKYINRNIKVSKIKAKYPEFARINGNKKVSTLMNEYGIYSFAGVRKYLRKFSLAKSKFVPARSKTLALKTSLVRSARYRHVKVKERVKNVA